MSFVFIQGIGDSGQGFANAILFIAFTKKIRNSFTRCVKCKKTISDERETPLSVPPNLQDSMPSHITRPLLYDSLETSLSYADDTPGHRHYGSIHNDECK